MSNVRAIQVLRQEVSVLRDLLALAFFPAASALAQTAPQTLPVREILVPVAPAESLLVTVAGAGRLVVLVPGLFGSAFGYRHLVKLLPAAGLRVMVIEPLGIGRSPRPRGADYSLTAQADRIAATLVRLNEPPAVVVAHSLGASMALRLAYRHPELVSALIALDGGPAEEAATPGFRRALRYVPWVKWMGGVRRLRPMIRKDLVAASGNSSWITEEVVNGYIAGPASDLDGTLLAFLAMAESREPERLAPHLSEIHCPVRLVLGGAVHKGGVESKHVKLLRERLPSFGIDTVAGAGQYLFEEQPSRIVEIIQRITPAHPPKLGSTR
jgi:pimeloyl-ACP methyl ester carboxylesterase